jgi:hypothetical protein
LGAGPSGVIVLKVAAGTRSPTLIVIVFLSQSLTNGNVALPRRCGRPGSSGRAGIYWVSPETEGAFAVFCWSMIFSENRNPPRIKYGAGFFGIML